MRIIAVIMVIALLMLGAASAAEVEKPPVLFAFVCRRTQMSAAVRQNHTRSDLIIFQCAEKDERRFLTASPVQIRLPRSKKIKKGTEMDDVEWEEDLENNNIDFKFMHNNIRDNFENRIVFSEYE